MKKTILWLCVFALLFGTITTALAADEEALEAAEELHELGLFSGVGTNEDGTPIYDLDRAPTRSEAVTMLVRLLGKEAEALEGTWETPFTDVKNWAKPYVGYAYANKLTFGTGATTFGGDDPVSATQYLTFVLRAMGYESGTDFRWNAAWELSDAIGMTDGRYNAGGGDFLRGDVAIISRNALYVPLKDGSQTLIEALGLAVAEEEPEPEEPEPEEPRAWYEPKNGRLYIRTNIDSSGWENGYSGTIRYRFSDGSCSYENNGGKGDRVSFRWFGLYNRDAGDSVTQVDYLVFDGSSFAYYEFWPLFKELDDFEAAVEACSEHLAARFTLYDRLTVAESGDSLTLKSIELTRDEENQKETYLAVLEEPLLDEGEYAIEYRADTGKQDCRLSAIFKSGESLTYTQNLHYYADGDYTGAFRIIYAVCEKQADGSILCVKTASNWVPYP